MIHNTFGYKLSRSKNERRRLFMMLLRDLIKHSQIKTTLTKAKAVQPLMEKLITKAKQGTPSAYRIILKTIDDGALVDHLISDAKDRFSARSSGYTRIVRIGARRGDSTEEVYLSFVDEIVVSQPVKENSKTEEKKTEKKTKKSLKKSSVLPKKKK